MVEDDRATRRALRAIVTRRGWDVSAASSLAEAWPILRSGPDYMILDLMLPDGDGLSLLEAVRDEGLPTRVVVTTGSADSTRLAAVRQLKPHSLLFKPVDIDELLRELGISP